jgi:hypothetical protein
MSKVKCPKCGNRNVAEYLWGMPAFTKKLEEELEVGHVVLGGCMITESDPKYHCNNCKNDFGGPPIKINKGGSLFDYAIETRNINFYVGGFFGGYINFAFVKSETGYYYEIKHSLAVDEYNSENNRTGKQELSFEEWSKLINKIYNKIFLLSWSKKYNNSDILDGEQWGLEIQLTGKRQLNYHGSNAYPVYWRELINIFRPYAKNAGVTIRTNGNKMMI